MRRTLAISLSLGLSVAIAKAADKPAPSPKPSTLTPENDSRLAKRSGSQTQKIGVLTYYPNAGGGFTFLDKGDIAFYAMRFDAIQCDIERVQNEFNRWHERIHTIGPSKLPHGYYTIYRGHMVNSTPGLVRDDEPIGHWCGDFPTEFRLSIKADDRETRLKLKSIIPVLEHAGHAP